MDDERIEIDADSLTMGELRAAETASGIDSSILLSRSAHRLLLMVFVHRYRSSGIAPNWSELENLRVRDVQSSISRSPRAARSKMSVA